MPKTKYVKKMGKKLPGVIISFENPKGGVGKSTLTALFAGYLYSMAKDSELEIGVVDIDDMQNTLGKLRTNEIEESDAQNEEYKVMSISSSEFIDQLDFLKECFDIIIVDFPGNLKQIGVVEALHFVDILIMPFTPNKIELDHTITFYKDVYEPIMNTRSKAGGKTIVRGVLNRVMANTVEFKAMIANKDNLPFKLLNNYIKDSRVDYQRYITTLMNDYRHTSDEFCEEVLELVNEFIHE